MGRWISRIRGGALTKFWSLMGFRFGRPRSHLHGSDAGWTDLLTLRAPGLQPDDTEAATPEDQSGVMASEPAPNAETDDAKCSEPLPVLKAGRQVGWIFKNGEAVAIERHECDFKISEDAG